jgi:hypothetical protein
MSTAAEDAFRTELLAARAGLMTQAHGISILFTLPLGATAENLLTQLSASCNRRLHLINTTLGALDTLDADGYSAAPGQGLPPDVIAQVQQFVNVILQAFRELGIIINGGQALGGQITFPEATDKP